jgi:hypothetical protein
VVGNAWGKATLCVVSEPLVLRGPNTLLHASPEEMRTALRDQTSDEDNRTKHVHAQEEIRLTPWVTNLGQEARKDKRMPTHLRHPPKPCL